MWLKGPSFLSFLIWLYETVVKKSEWDYTEWFLQESDAFYTVMVERLEETIETEIKKSLGIELMS